nr:hypothetical protein CFP56_69554 [Quercus suber]
MDENRETNATNHVAEMVAYLGLPPLEYLGRSGVTKNVFDEQGQSLPSAYSFRRSNVSRLLEARRRSQRTATISGASRGGPGRRGQETIPSLCTDYVEMASGGEEPSH